MTRLLLIFLTAFRVAFVGDPQVDNPVELEYARKSVYKELQERKDLDLVVILGDLVNENVSLIAPSEASLDSITMKTGCTWARVNGNHDGPVPAHGPGSDCSFTTHGVRFILMNNVRRLKRGGYEGGFSAKQKTWLDSLMRATDMNTGIVICTHIPISQSKGRDSLSNIIAPHQKVLFVSGHTHCVNRQILERGMEEIQAGASCGTWWRGRKDNDGIPYALMNCGAPRGYFTADFKEHRRACASSSGKGWYSVDYKCIGRSPEERYSITEKDGRLFINVYGGSREGHVYIRQNGRWTEAPHCYTTAPEVLDVIEENRHMTQEHSREYRKAHKDEFIPMRQLPSPHVWVIDKTSDAPYGIRYQDGRMAF